MLRSKLNPLWLLVIVPLAVVVGWLAAGRSESLFGCKPLGQDKQKELLAYVAQRFRLAGDVQPFVVDSSTIKGSCVRRVEVASKAWPKPVQFYLSADQRYVSSTWYDLQRGTPLRRPPLQASQSALDAKATEEITSEGAYTQGPPNAPVTIVEFADFQCPYCKRMAATLRHDVLPAHAEQIRIVFREKPLPFHTWAQQAAEVAACTGMQNKAAFWKLHDFFFENQEQLTKDNLGSKASAFLARQTNINVSRMRACVESGEMRPQIERDAAMANKYGVTSTPTLFINGTRVTGARDSAYLNALISEKLDQEAQSKPQAALLGASTANSTRLR